MPPLVVPTTVNSGTKPGSWDKAWPRARIIILATRWSRSGCRIPSSQPARFASSTWPAVLQRQFSTGKAVTGVTQSRASRRDIRVWSNPLPSGLTMPAATTATRALFCAGFIWENSGIFRVAARPRFYLLSLAKASTNHAEKKTEARCVGRLSVEFFSGDLKSDEREQWPGGVFLS